MTVVEASAGTYRSRVDGTLVLSVEIEPRFVAAALELFRTPGTPLAIAALKVNGKADDPPKPAKRELGAICWWLVQRCREPEFQAWVAKAAPGIVPSEESAAAYCRFACGVDSRADIDGNEYAEAMYHKLIRGPYSKHMLARGKA